MSGLMPYYILQERTAADKPLAGGTIYFYESGTFTPKSVYADAELTTPLGTSVMLDSAGKAVIFLGDGAYRIWVKDSTGAEIMPWVDGIVVNGSAGQPGSNGQLAICLTYDDVRTLPINSVPDMVLVCGRTMEGDGGQGIYSYLPGNTETDDGGVMLVQSSSGRRYMRIFTGPIDVSWYGVKYGISSGDQGPNYTAALAGSVRWRIGVASSSTIYLGSNLVIPAYARIVLDGVGTASTSFFVAPLGGANISFADNSQIVAASGTVFGDNVTATFAASVNVGGALRLSWFGGDGDTVWNKLCSCSTHPYNVIVDKATTISVALTVPAYFAVDWYNASAIHVVAAVAVSIPGCVYRGYDSIILYDTLAHVSTIDLGNAVPYLEWFGGVAGVSHTIDNSVAFKSALNASVIALRSFHYYVKATTGYTVARNVRIYGDASTLELDTNITTTTLNIVNTTISGVGSWTSTATGNSLDHCTSSISLSLQMPTVSYSTLSSVSDLGVTTYSTVAGNTVLFGDVSFSTISCETIGIGSNISFFDCQMTQTASTEPFMQQASTLSKISINGGTCDYQSTLLYSHSDADIDVYINGTLNSDNWTKCLCNGYVRVHLYNTNAQGNTSAYDIDGNTLGVAVPVLIATPDPKVATSSAIYWRGVGSPTSDGMYLLLNVAATLGTTPWDAGTIRWLGQPRDGSGTPDPTLHSLWRYGGLITLEIIWPSGSTTTSGMKPTIGFMSGNMWDLYGSQETPGVGRAIWGQSVPVGIPATTDAVMKAQCACWGGQIDLATTNSVSNPNWTDDWGDYNRAYIPGINLIDCVPRIIIWDSGVGGTLPAGTKIKVTIDPKLPLTNIYDKFFPRTQWELTTGTAHTSLQTSYSMGYSCMRWPYQFRSCDSNGLAVALTRRPVGIATGAAVDLPTSVWQNGNTIVTSYA